MRRYATLCMMSAAVMLLAGIGTASAVESECEDCHAKLTPMIVKDFNRGVMSETMGCADCHGQGHTGMDDADKVFAEAINIVAGLRRDGIIEVKEGEGVYPQLLSFYEVDTTVEQHLYDTFVDYRMKTFQGTFHINSDYTT